MQEEKTQTTEEEIEEVEETLEDSKGEESKDTKGNSDDKTFTQEEVNKLIQERLERDRKKRQEEAETERLKEKEEFKELYEKTVSELQELKEREALRERNEKIIESFKNHGFDDERAKASLKWVSVQIEDDDSIESVVKEYVESHQVDYADPTPSLGSKKRVDISEDDAVKDIIAGASKYKTKINY